MVKKITILNNKETPKKNNTFRIILIIISIIIILIVSSYIMFVTKYKSLIDWWEKGQDKGKTYKNLFNIKTMMAARSSNFWYFFFNLGDPPLAKFTTSQYLFIISHLLQYIQYEDPETGRQQGILTPYSLCKGLILSSEDPSPDQRYLDWLTDKKYPTRGNTLIGEENGIKVEENSANELTYTQKTVSKCDEDNASLSCYYYVIDEGITDNVKPYPRTINTEGWKGLILEWLNGFSGPPTKDTGWIYGTDKDGILKLIPYPGFKGKDNLDIWLKETTRGQDGQFVYKNGVADNFMSRFGIVPENPLFTYWFNDNYDEKGMKVDNSTFATLLNNETADAGGWVGFLKNNDNFTVAEYVSLIKSKTSYEPPDPPPPCIPTPWYTTVFGAGAAGGAALSMLAFLPGGAAVGLTIGICLSAAAAATSSVLQSTAKSC